MREVFMIKIIRRLTGIGGRGEFYVDKTVCIIIAVVVGSLLLAGLYGVFNDTVIPGLAERISAWFS